MAELGAGGGSDYPAALDTDITPEIDLVHDARADVPNDLADAIMKIETHLGVAGGGGEITLTHDLDADGNSINNVLAIDGLSAAEIAEYAKLGATTLSAAQLGYLGAMNQGVATTDSPVAFADHIRHIKTSEVADNGTLDLSTTHAVTYGIVIFSSTQGYGAIFGALAGVAEPIEISDPFNKWSATKDTAASTNVYAEGGVLMLQNKMGVAVIYRILFIGGS